MTHDLTLSEIHRHHTHLLREIEEGYARLMDGAESNKNLERERDHYVRFLTEELIPHALGEEETIYDDGAHEKDLSALVYGMTDEHQRIVALIEQLKTAKDTLHIIAAASGFITLLTAHFDKENRLLLPALNSRGLLPD